MIREVKMLDRWVLVDKESNTIKMEGTLKEVLEHLDVKSPEDIPNRYELNKPENDPLSKE